MLLARGAVALVLNSAQWFFIAPAVVTAIGGCVFIGSALLSKPLVAPVVNELIPNSVLDLSDPASPGGHDQGLCAVRRGTAC